MTTNYHTAIATGAAGDHTTFNNPNGELDLVITNMLSATQEFSGLLAGAGSLDASAIAELDSTTQGFLPPRMTTTQRDNISIPAEGLMIYNTTLDRYDYYNGSTWEEITATAVFAGVRAKGNTATISSSSPSVTNNIQLDNLERFDTDNYHDLVTNSNRITIPSGKAGKYLITGCVSWELNTGNVTIRVRITHSGADGGIELSKYVPSASAHSGRLTVTEIVDMAVGDICRLGVSHNRGLDMDVENVGVLSPELTAVLLG